MAFALSIAPQSQYTEQRYYHLLKEFKLSGSNALFVKYCGLKQNPRRTEK